MSETAQIIVAISIAVCILTAAFAVTIVAVDIIKGWKNDA